MAVIKVPKQMISPQVPVDLYRNGQLERSYDSVSECARDLHVSYQTVKYLIASGKVYYAVDICAFAVPVMPALKIDI